MAAATPPGHYVGPTLYSVTAIIDVVKVEKKVLNMDPYKSHFECGILWRESLENEQTGF